MNKTSPLEQLCCVVVHSKGSWLYSNQFLAKTIYLYELSAGFAYEAIEASEQKSTIIDYFIY